MRALPFKVGGGVSALGARSRKTPAYALFLSLLPMLREKGVGGMRGFPPKLGAGAIAWGRALARLPPLLFLPLLPMLWEKGVGGMRDAYPKIGAHDACPLLHSQFDFCGFKPRRGR